MFSFVLMSAIRFFIGYAFQIQWFWKWSYVFGGIAMIVLLIEGLRYSVPDVSFEELMGPPEEATGYSNYEARQPGGTVYILTHIMFAAPRSTVNAVRVFRSLVHLGPAACAASERALTKIAETGGWLPARKPGLPDNVVAGLARMGLLWQRGKETDREVRPHPSIKQEYFPECAPFKPPGEGTPGASVQ